MCLFLPKQQGFTHGSIGAGKLAIEELGMANGFGVDYSVNSADINPTNLAQYAAVIFLNTTGDILNDTQQTAFEQYIRAGNGFVGIHSATDTEYGWAWYAGLIGTHFQNHPSIQNADIEIVDGTHASTTHLSGTWNRTDEWYNFQNQPVGVNILLKIDESTYSGGNMGESAPN